MIGGDWRREGLTTNSQTGGGGGGGVYVWPISSPPTHTQQQQPGEGELSRKQAGCFYGGHNSDYRTGVDEKKLTLPFFSLLSCGELNRGYGEAVEEGGGRNSCVIICQQRSKISCMKYRGGGSKKEFFGGQKSPPARLLFLSNELGSCKQTNGL